MNALLLTIQLQDSSLFTGVGNGEENSSRTLPFIPGAALRGALVARYQASQADLLADPTAVQLFFSDGVRFLNGYPTLQANGARALPVPASWRKLKGMPLDGAIVSDIALLPDGSTPSDDSSNKQYQPVGRHFFAPVFDKHGKLVPGKFQCFNPEEELAIHIASQNRGRVKRGESTVFQYQSIEKGQIFAAAILAKNAQDLDYFKKTLQAGEILQLGRSRSARYGRALLVRVEESDNSTWREYEPAQQAGQALIINFLSDAILRDDSGQPTHDLDAHISRIFSKQVKAKKIFLKTGVSGGFNRKWGLPLPQAPTIGMGSVFVYPAGTLTPAEQKKLVEEGLGERRLDGFGRVAVNWLSSPELTISKPTPTSAPEFHQLSPASQNLAQVMAKRLLRKKLDGLLLVAAQTHHIRGNITNHQLSRMRGLLRVVINQPVKDLAPIQRFLAGLKKTARSQFERARVIQASRPEDVGTTGPRLLNWLTAQLEEQNGLDFAACQVPVVAGQKAQIDEALKLEYSLRFIELVIDRSMKSKRKDGLS